MQMLYDSESFVVVQVDTEQGGVGHSPSTSSTGHPEMTRHGFEIVDKRTGKELYLDGSWAEMFQQQLNVWLETTPSQDEVEDLLDRYAVLAQNPVIVH